MSIKLLDFESPTGFREDQQGSENLLPTLDFLGNDQGETGKKNRKNQRAVGLIRGMEYPPSHDHKRNCDLKQEIDALRVAFVRAILQSPALTRKLATVYDPESSKKIVDSKLAATLDLEAPSDETLSRRRKKIASACLSLASLMEEGAGQDHPAVIDRQDSIAKDYASIYMRYPLQRSFLRYTEALARKKPSSLSPSTLMNLNKSHQELSNKRHEFILGNMRYILSVNQDNDGVAGHYEDRVQEGFFLLSECLERWNPNLSAFISCVNIFARPYYHRFLIKNNYTCIPPHHVFNQAFPYGNKKRSLEAAQGQAFTDAEACETLGMNVEEVAHFNRMVWMTSLSAPVAQKNGVPFLSNRLISPMEKSPDVKIEEKRLSKALRAAMQELLPLQKEVLKIRLDEDVSLHDIGNRFHFTRETARNTEKAALKVMRYKKPLKDYWDDFAETMADASFSLSREKKNGKAKKAQHVIDRGNTKQSALVYEISPG